MYKKFLPCFLFKELKNVNQNCATWLLVSSWWQHRFFLIAAYSGFDQTCLFKDIFWQMLKVETMYTCHSVKGSSYAVVNLPSNWSCGLWCNSTLCSRRRIKKLLEYRIPSELKLLFRQDLLPWADMGKDMTEILCKFL
jgi:hypothetical protein